MTIVRSYSIPYQRVENNGKINNDTFHAWDREFQRLMASVAAITTNVLHTP